jgi:lipopolysaccharide export system protein LptA
MVTFAGDVQATRDDFSMNCQKLLLYYNNKTSSKDGELEGLNIEKIIATGKVKINNAGGGLATAEKAVYYQNEEKVVLTGNPVLKQENNFVEGSKITLFIRKKLSIVEGSGSNKIRAILFPRTEKGSLVGR